MRRNSSWNPDVLKELTYLQHLIKNLSFVCDDEGIKEVYAKEVSKFRKLRHDLEISLKSTIDAMAITSRPECNFVIKKVKTKDYIYTILQFPNDRIEVRTLLYKFLTNNRKISTHTIADKFISNVSNELKKNGYEVNIGNIHVNNIGINFDLFSKEYFLQAVIDTNTGLIWLKGYVLNKETLNKIETLTKILINTLNQL